ncbi:MAG: class I SAM-dependent RNA methyltransferase [Alphaproteobacteria bacterium]|nr:class I SAM-dependent RNA methyltransferase [Alphaproteobacteria bacterium]
MTTCPHFPLCGGCVSQDVPHAQYIAAKRDIVVSALAKAGVKAEVAAVIETPPRSRRRAVFKIKSLPEGLHIGFHAAKSHTIVDMHQCDILTPGLFALVGRLRNKLEPIFGAGEAAELHVTECDNGFDAAFRWSRKVAPNLVTLLSRALADTGIIRLTMATDTVFEIVAPVVTLGPAQVKPPPHAFLQPTRAGEAALQEKVLAMTAKAKNIADLFCGLGTFTLPLATQARVLAVENEKPMLNALTAAARNTKGLKPVTTEVRDLFKRPLTPLELNAYDAVVLDPPRAGAEAQCKALAASRVRRLAYVSCDAQTFARDAAILVAGGFTLGPVTPVDQFLFSSHIELVAGFER